MTALLLTNATGIPRLPQRDLNAIRDNILHNRDAGSGILKTVNDGTDSDLVQLRQPPNLMNLYLAVNSTNPNRNTHFVRFLSLASSASASPPPTASTPLIVSPNVSAMKAEVVAENRHSLEARGYTAQETVDLYAYNLTKRVNDSLERNGYANFSGSWGDRSTDDVNEYVGWLYEAVAASERTSAATQTHASAPQAMAPSTVASSGPMAATDLTSLKDDVLAALAVEPS